MGQINFTRIFGYGGGMEPIFVDIDPARVQRYFLMRTPRDQLRMNTNRILLPRPLCRGGWDRRTLPVQEHPVYKLMEGFYRHDCEPGPCHAVLAAYYRERGLSAEEARAKADRKLEGHLAKYGGMIRDMIVNGYRTGQARDEVGIAIARDGALLKASGGWHRFAAAHLLRISPVWAEVRFVHPIWMRKLCGFKGVRAPEEMREAVKRGLLQLSD